ncbi:hypothetical protein ACPEIF_16265 [Streptomyces sp. NPDC012600]
MTESCFTRRLRGSAYQRAYASCTAPFAAVGEARLMSGGTSDVRRHV